MADGLVRLIREAGTTLAETSGNATLTTVAPTLVDKGKKLLEVLGKKMHSELYFQVPLKLCLPLCTHLDINICNPWPWVGLHNMRFRDSEVRIIFNTMVYI